MRVIIKIQQRNYLLCEVTCLFFLNLNNNQSNQTPISTSVHSSDTKLIYQTVCMND